MRPERIAFLGEDRGDFFGELILPEVKTRSYAEYEYGYECFPGTRSVDKCERLLGMGIGTTYSALRSASPHESPERLDKGSLLSYLGSIGQHALARDNPVLLNLGPTRADTLLEANTAGISEADISAGDVLHDVVR